MARRFTAISTADFKKRLVTKMAENAAHKAFFLIPSKTLREAMTVEFVSDDGITTEGRLHIPHYWAVYLHDGRGPVTQVNSSVLIWFENPKDDPRIKGGKKYPVAREDIQSMTSFRVAYEKGLRENNRRREQGLPPFMIVVKRAGPAKGDPFFAEGMKGFASEITPLVHREFDSWLRQFVPSESLPAVCKLR